MRVVSARVLIAHKELHLVLDSILRRVREDGGPFAVVLTAGGKVTQVHQTGDSVGTTEDTVRLIEAGLLLWAREGKCKAVGICLGCNSRAGDKKKIQVIFEHEDGTACRILLPHDGGRAGHFIYQEANARSIPKKFFTETRAGAGARRF